MIKLACVLAMFTVIPMARGQGGQGGQGGRGAPSFEAVAADHPAGDLLRRIFAGNAKIPDGFVPTGMTRKDYLPLIAGNVDWWKHFQNEAGEIVDPYEYQERQYSTPAFALAAALLVQEAGRADLLEPAQRAFSRSIEELVTKTTADAHADFYIPMLVHARRILRDKVPADVAAKWDRQFISIVPENVYSDTKGGGNWNIVNVSGELLRRRDGLVAPDQRDEQLKYLETCLDNQMGRGEEGGRFTNHGMYADPAVPLAYDAFPRLWLEDALADGALSEGALRGERVQALEMFLAKGGFSGLLLISPSGEWASGGRSAQHQWNEAQNAEICEINANKWKKAGRADIAGAFKRAAHLCLTSMLRWQRPSGEMWIVKNFGDPARRHGFEGYSFHSQYNLLPMGMLAIAYLRANDSIEETPAPSESAGYVFDLRETFHHIAAACGGYYVLIDTGADRHYGSTGLQRLHRAGVELSPYTDTPSPETGYHPPEQLSHAPMTLALEWKDAKGTWHNLGEFGIPTPVRPKNPEEQVGAPKPEQATTRAELQVQEQSGERVRFSIKYDTAGDDARTIEEEYVITKGGVEGTQRIGGDVPSAVRVLFPALVNDAARATDIQIQKNKVTIARCGAMTREIGDPAKSWFTKPGGVLKFELTGAADAQLMLTGPQVLTHNGYVQALVADLPDGMKEMKWKMTLEPEPKRER